MTIQGLNWITGKLTGLGISYQYMEYSRHPVPDPYWVGQYTELSSVDEGGEFQSDFLLIGTTKHKYLDLEQTKKQIMDLFPEYGLTDILANGWGIACCYESSMPIPSIEEGVHRIQITLNVKEWKGE